MNVLAHPPKVGLPPNGWRNSAHFSTIVPRMNVSNVPISAAFALTLRMYASKRPMIFQSESNRVLASGF